MEMDPSMYTPPRSERGEQTKSYGVIVSDRGSVLCVKDRRSGKIGFPKGSVDPGESGPACASREAYEETGLSIVVTYERIFRAFGTKYYCMDRHECCLGTTLRPVDTVEVSEAMWIPERELRATRNYKLNSHVRQWLKW